MKKLYRKRHDKKVAGLCAGLAEYLEMDVSIVRILTIAACLVGTLGFWVYLVAAIVVPMEP